MGQQKVAAGKTHPPGHASAKFTVARIFPPALPSGMRFRSPKVPLFSAVLLIACNGCITGSLITIGTVLGALGSAASTGSDVYKLGKLDATLMTSAPACHAAVITSADDLGLKVEIDQQVDKPNDVWEMTLRDKLNAPVGIHIEARTGKMCRCRVDVGVFGSEPTAHLFMERIRAHLNLTQTGAPGSENSKNENRSLE